jgi:hypothetical protein
MSSSPGARVIRYSNIIHGCLKMAPYLVYGEKTCEYLLILLETQSLFHMCSEFELSFREQSAYEIVPVCCSEEGLLSIVCGDDDHYLCSVIEIAPPRAAMIDRIVCCQYAPAHTLHVS